MFSKSTATESLMKPSSNKPPLKSLVTIAIPTMRRWSFLKNSIPAYLARPEVAEVIVCDETGEDYDLLHKTFGDQKKLRLYKNEKRLGIYENKMKCLSLATGGWVALLDSDNIFGDEWFEALHDLDFSNKKLIFASADFKSLNVKTGVIKRDCESFSGLMLKANNWNTTLTQPKWNFLLNDGNWIMHSSAFYTLDKNVKSESLQAADAIFMARCFVKGGYSIYYVPGLEYTHIVHPGSSWLLTDVESSNILLSTNWRI
jgi:glycosyltransferase involved in cell wall biosynthesis